MLFTMAMQPMPALIKSASQTSGSNLLALDPASGDNIWLTTQYAWISVATDDFAHQSVRDFTAQVVSNLQNKYPGIGMTHSSFGGAQLAYWSLAPTFMNDGMFDQDVLGSYPPDSGAFLRRFGPVIDPGGFWKRTGGFRIG